MLASEAGVSVDVMRKYIDKLIQEEGFEMSSVKKKTRRVQDGDAYTNQKINNEPVSRYLGDDVFYPFIPKGAKSDGGVDIGYGIKLQDKAGNFLHPDFVANEADLKKLEKMGMSEKDFSNLFSSVVLQKIRNSKKSYNEHNNLGTYQDTRGFNESWNKSRTYRSLGDYEKLMLLDTEYNVSGGVSSYPRMMSGIAADNLDVIGQEYKHTAGGLEMGRNAMRKDFFIKNIAMNKNIAGDKLKLYLDTVAQPTKEGVFSKLYNVTQDFLFENTSLPMLDFTISESIPEIGGKRVQLGGQQGDTINYMEGPLKENPYN